MIRRGRVGQHGSIHVGNEPPSVSHKQAKEALRFSVLGFPPVSKGVQDALYPAPDRFQCDGYEHENIPLYNIFAPGSASVL